LQLEANLHAKQKRSKNNIVDFLLLKVDLELLAYQLDGLISGTPQVYMPSILLSSWQMFSGSFLLLSYLVVAAAASFWRLFFYCPIFIS